MRRVRHVGEQELLDTFAKIISAKKTVTYGITVGVGDDTAVLKPLPGRDLLVTTDVQVEDRHFRREWFDGAALGWRLAAVNLSDIAAMGGRPLYGLVSFAVPPDLEIGYVEGIERGVRDHLAKYGASIVGGNVSGIEKTLVCDLTLVGSVTTGKAWRRCCRPDRDAVVVVGNLGEARAGLEVLDAGGETKRFNKLIRAFKKPTPLLDVADLLRRDRAVHGAIDVSDGFSTDLIRICRASGAGCEIDASALPLSKVFHYFCEASGKDPIEEALHGGEDYALILSVEGKKADAIAERIRQKLKLPTRVVGRFTSAAASYAIVGADGRRTPIVARGWDHLSTQRD